MNKLDINSFYLITFFLKPHEISTFGNVSNYIYNYCRNFMTYSYNYYGNNTLYYILRTAKWIVRECTCQIIQDCIDKKLILNSIYFDDCFNQSIEYLSHCIHLQQITFGAEFNQPIEALVHCINLQQITFGAEFNQPVESLSKHIKIIK